MKTKKVFFQDLSENYMNEPKAGKTGNENTVFAPKHKSTQIWGIFCRKSKTRLDSLRPNISSNIEISMNSKRKLSVRFGLSWLSAESGVSLLVGEREANLWIATRFFFLQ